MNRCLKRARDGDPIAVESLVNALRPRIRKMAVHYGHRTGEDADDLLQEAWLGLLEALPELDLEIGSPEQYLIARAKWRVLDTIKRARVRRCEPLDEEGAGRTTFSVAEQAVASVRASDFVRRLRKPQRRALRCLLAGLTWREAGKALGCASANIAYHVRQIKREYEEWSREL